MATAEDPKKQLYMEGKTSSDPNENRFSRAEVEELADKGLIILQDKVYNVSLFMKDHPGGDDILKEVFGTDATEDWEFVRHSNDAKELMKNYLIGVLNWDEQTAQVRKRAPPPPVVNYDEEEAGMPIGIYAVGGLLVLYLYYQFA